MRTRQLMKKENLNNKNREVRNFSVGNGERIFGKEIKNLDMKKNANKNNNQEKFLVIKTNEDDKLKQKSLALKDKKIDDSKIDENLNKNANKKNVNNPKKIINKKENITKKENLNNVNCMSMLSNADLLNNKENIEIDVFLPAQSKIGINKANNKIKNNQKPKQENEQANTSYGYNFLNPSSVSLNANNKTITNSNDLTSVNQRNVQNQDDGVNHVLRPANKQGDNHSKETNNDFKKFGKYYVKSTILAQSRYYSDNNEVGNAINRKSDVTSNKGQIQVNKNAVADRIIHIENNAINKNSKTYDQALRTNILLDIKHSNNPQYLQEYVDEIFEDLHKTEHLNVPQMNEMLAIQTEVNDSMRSVVVDWIIEVSMGFKLREETLFFAINLFDRYLGIKNLKAKDLQLAGIGALSIACKYEEIYAPEMRDYKYVCDNQYSIENILKIEYDILAALKFDLLHSSPLTFLKRYHFISQGAFKSLYLAQFILETSLLEYNMLEFSSSIKAATCLYLSRKLLQYEDVWPMELVVCTGYNEEQLEICIVRISMIISLIPNLTLTSTKKKYSDKKYFEISKEYCKFH